MERYIIHKTGTHREDPTRIKAGSRRARTRARRTTLLDPSSVPRSPPYPKCPILQIQGIYRKAMISQSYISYTSTPNCP